MLFKTIYATALKELLLLRRDISGLILLFVMPALLVILITLIQDRVTQTDITVLLIDHDRGEVSTLLKEMFGLSGDITLIEELDQQQIDEEKARYLLAKGTYQFAIILPERLSARVNEAASSHINEDGLAAANSELPEITILFDPTVQGGFRTAVTEALRRASQGIQSRLLLRYGIEHLAESLPPYVRDTMADTNGNIEKQLPQLFNSKSFINIKQQFSAGMQFIRQPTAVQQNVPAWALFGIFLTVVPLSGSVIRERNSGISRRLAILPTSYWLLNSGRIVAYMLICCIQFLLIFGAGIYLLPLFGPPPFDPSGAWLPIILLILLVSAAACSYGLFLGTLCKTEAQTAVIGPVSVVIASAVGGIMVPVYALPDSIRMFSSISPLYWGQSGFYDLLLRQGRFIDLLPELGLLAGFSLIMLTLSSLLSKKSG